MPKKPENVSPNSSVPKIAELLANPELLTKIRAEVEAQYPDAFAENLIKDPELLALIDQLAEEEATAEQEPKE